MDDLEQKIAEVLNDPQQLAGIVELAKTFGLAPQDSGAALPQQAASPPESNAAAQSATPALTQQMPQTPAFSPTEGAAGLPFGAQAASSAPAGENTPPAGAFALGQWAQTAGRDSRQDALLKALRPFLSPAKREKIDRAMQIAKLSRLAQIALRKPGKGTLEER